MKKIIFTLITVFTSVNFAYAEDHSTYDSFNAFRKAIAPIFLNYCKSNNQDFKLCLEEKTSTLRKNFEIVELKGGKKFYNKCYEKIITNNKTKNINLDQFNYCVSNYKNYLIAPTSLPDYNQYFIDKDELFNLRFYFCRKTNFLNIKKSNDCLIQQKNSQERFVKIFFKEDQGSFSNDVFKKSMEKEKKCIKDNEKNDKGTLYFDFNKITKCIIES